VKSKRLIDICDFAVGLSRQLYGRTMSSSAPGHRLMGTWHPLAWCVITSFNFPAAVWSLEYGDRTRVRLLRLLESPPNLRRSRLTLVPRYSRGLLPSRRAAVRQSSCAGRGGPGSGTRRAPGSDVDQRLPVRPIWAGGRSASGRTIWPGPCSSWRHNARSSRRQPIWTRDAGDWFGAVERRGQRCTTCESDCA